MSGPTRLNAQLDQIFVDANLFNKYPPENVEVGSPIANSDHNSVFAKSTTDSQKRLIKKFLLYDFRLSNILAFEETFLSQDFGSLYSESDIDKKCIKFYDFMKDSLSAVPVNEIYLTNTDAPWMTPFLKHLINKRWEAYRLRQWGLFCSLKVKVKEKILVAKKNFLKKKRESARG